MGYPNNPVRRKQYYQQPEQQRMTRLRNRRKYNKLRAAVLAYLGNECKHCGFVDPRALQVDHVNGCGGKNRPCNDKTYREVLSGRFDTKYQLLCANCNWIKRAERGETTLRKDY